jgi:lysophospholipase L1-like esterase
MLKTAIISSLSLLLCQQVFSDAVLDDFEKLDKWKKIRGKGSFEAAPDAAEGKGAIKVKGPVMLQKIFKYDWKKRNDWDKKLKGVSFWVKGDGSDQWGCISLGGSSWSYIYYFPVKNTEWKKITVPFSEFTPEGYVVQDLGSKGALPPSGIDRIRIGDKWHIAHRNAKIPAFSYCIDNIELVENAPQDKDSGKKYEPRKFSEVIEQLKNGKPTTIFCIGDSITAGTGLKKPDDERYANVLQKELRKHFKKDNITVESRAVGGARTEHSIGWVNRDFADKSPDLLTYMIGYNNKSGAYSPDTFKKGLEKYIDRVTRKTKGKTAILLITTIPGLGPRFEMMDDYADIVREVAKERNLPVCDMQKEFKKIGKENMDKYLRDMAHPNDKGHKIFADTLYEFIVEKTK